jgi:hypothetical protein
MPVGAWRLPGTSVGGGSTRPSFTIPCRRWLVESGGALAAAVGASRKYITPAIGNQHGHSLIISITPFACGHFDTRQPRGYRHREALTSLPKTSEDCEPTGMDATAMTKPRRCQNAMPSARGSQGHPRTRRRRDTADSFSSFGYGVWLWGVAMGVEPRYLDSLESRSRRVEVPESDRWKSREFRRPRPRRGRRNSHRFHGFGLLGVPFVVAHQLLNARVTRYPSTRAGSD